MITLNFHLFHSHGQRSVLIQSQLYFLSPVNFCLWRRIQECLCLLPLEVAPSPSEKQTWKSTHPAPSLRLFVLAPRGSTSQPHQ